MKLYLIAGEASGDARGAELIEALRLAMPETEFYGAGGLQMRRLVGERLFDWAAEAVVGLWDVLKKYGYFRAQFARMLQEIVTLKPSAVIFIDYPGFNLRLAAALRERPELRATKLIYYISPQVWAWHQSRIPKMARYLDLMLCLFPFEEPLYHASGLHAVCVGHPLLDSLEEERVASIRDDDLVGLFPGSREKEVRRIFPIMLQAARSLQAERPQTRFIAAAASTTLAQQMNEELASQELSLSFCEVKTDFSRRLMQEAGAGMVASGTATLEAAFFGLPFAILYKVAWLTWTVGKRLVRVPYLGMPNILAGGEIVREFLQSEARPLAIAQHTKQLLDSVELRGRTTTELKKVIGLLGERGAARRAASAIKSLLFK